VDQAVQRRQVLGRLQLPPVAVLGVVAGVESGDEVPRVCEAEIALAGQRSPGRGAVVGEHPQLPRHPGGADRRTLLAVVGEPHRPDHRRIVIAGELVDELIGHPGRQAAEIP
jgi:hypothetical protein